MRDNSRDPQDEIDPRRRALLAAAGIALPAGCAHGGGAGASAPPQQGASVLGMPFPATAEVRVGVIGVGGRGSFLLNLLLGLEGVSVRAVCDILPEKAAAARAAIRKAGQPDPALFTSGERDFEGLCRREDLGSGADRHPLGVARADGAWRRWNAVTTPRSRCRPRPAWRTAGGWSTPPSAPAATA